MKSKQCINRYTLHIFVLHIFILHIFMLHNILYDPLYDPLLKSLNNKRGLLQIINGDLVYQYHPNYSPYNKYTFEIRFVKIGNRRDEVMKSSLITEKSSKVTGSDYHHWGRGWGMGDGGWGWGGVGREEVGAGGRGRGVGMNKGGKERRRGW